MSDSDHVFLKYACVRCACWMMRIVWKDHKKESNIGGKTETMKQTASRGVSIPSHCAMKLLPGGSGGIGNQNAAMISPAKLDGHLGNGNRNVELRHKESNQKQQILRTEIGQFFGNKKGCEQELCICLLCHCNSWPINGSPFWWNRICG